MFYIYYKMGNYSYKPMSEMCIFFYNQKKVYMGNWKNNKPEGDVIIIDGEKIKIVKHYNFYPQMDIDIYFNNGYKYTYYDIPCTSGAYIDSQEMI